MLISLLNRDNKSVCQTSNIDDVNAYLTYFAILSNSNTPVKGICDISVVTIEAFVEIASSK